MPNFKISGVPMTIIGATILLIMISSSIVISAQTPRILTVDDPNLQEGTLLSTGEKQETDA